MSVGGDAVHPDLGNASQARHGILQSGASALPLSPLPRLSGASRTLERASSKLAIGVWKDPCCSLSDFSDDFSDELLGDSHVQM